MAQQTSEQIEIVEFETGFTMVFNELICDSRLRLQTRAVLILMLSKPKSWDFSVRGMAKIAGVTKDTMSRMVKELEAAGYLKRKVQPHAKNGRFEKAGFLVAGKPIFGSEDAPCPDLPYTEEPYTKKSPQVNKEQVKKEQEKENGFSPVEVPGEGLAEKTGCAVDGKDKPDPKVSDPMCAILPKRERRRKSVPVWRPERFEGFWAAYPRDEERAKAAEQWDRLCTGNEQQDDGRLDEIARGLKRHLECEDWRKGIGIPHAWRWLRDRRWTEKQKQPLPRGPASSAGEEDDWHVI